MYIYSELYTASNCVHVQYKRMSIYVPHPLFSQALLWSSLDAWVVYISKIAFAMSLRLNSWSTVTNFRRVTTFSKFLRRLSNCVVGLPPSLSSSRFIRFRSSTETPSLRPTSNQVLQYGSFASNLLSLSSTSDGILSIFRSAKKRKIKLPNNWSISLDPNETNPALVNWETHETVNTKIISGMLLFVSQSEA